jgi:hypothetical protein
VAFVVKPEAGSFVSLRPNEGGVAIMNKPLFVAAIAAIALFGLSANTCGGDKAADKPADQPAPAAPVQPETPPQ